MVFWSCNVRPSRLLFSGPLYFFTCSRLLAFFLCFLVLFHSCCYHARVFGKTLVNELPISYSRTEWYLLFANPRWSKWSLSCLSKTNYINNNIVILKYIYFFPRRISPSLTEASPGKLYSPKLTSSSVLFSYFIRAVLVHKCLGKHSCMSSTFHIAILNDSFFFTRGE